MRTFIVLLALAAGCATPNKYYPDAGEPVPGDASGSVPDVSGPGGDSGALDTAFSPAPDASTPTDIGSTDTPVNQGGRDARPDEAVVVDSGPSPDLAPAVCATNERKCGRHRDEVSLRSERFEVDEVCSGRVPYCFQGACTGCGGGKGVCGDGLCPMNCPNETASACFADCATLPEGEARTGSTGIIPRTNLWGECGPYQAVIGILTPTPISVTCSFDRAEYAHRASDCRAVDYAEDPTTSNEFVSTCRDDELVAGLGKTVPGQYLCCKANVHHKDCQRQLSCRVDQYAADVIASEAVSGTVMLWCCSP
jgi:hypothetical protein